MYYLNAICRRGHQHNAFMLSDALGHIHAQLRVVLVVT